MKRILFAIYPFLMAIYPVVALRNFNVVYVDLATILRTILIVLILTALSWMVLFAVLRDGSRSGIMASLTMIIILSYGHLHIQSAAVFGEPIRHSFLLTILALLYGGVFWLVSRGSAFVEVVRNFLSVMAAILVFMAVGQSLYYDFLTYQSMKQLSAPSERTGQEDGLAALPDIYLIVLDAHGRQDVLEEKFGYDSSAFLQELRDLGFYVASCSQSNYASTNLSLSSLFNMDYIPPSLNVNAKLPPLKETRVRQTLSALGYTTIAFENRASGHFDLQEDIRLSQNQLLLGELSLTGGLNEFEEVMFRTSVIKFFWDTELILGFDEEAMIRLENYEHYQQTRFILAKLADVPQMKGPKFVFVHIMVPHSPFVFTSEGEFRPVEDTSRNGYADNARFIDENILASIQDILARSGRPPIIVLMGDHGPPPGKYASRENRMQILNAYYVHSEAAADLYASVTPVNSFRVILNHYFGESYPLVEDISHYAYKSSQLSDAPRVENNCVPSP